MDDLPEPPNVPKGLIEALYISTLSSELTGYFCAAVYEHCWREEVKKVVQDHEIACSEEEHFYICERAELARRNAETCAARARSLSR